MGGKLFLAGVAKTPDAGVSDGPTVGQLIPPPQFASNGRGANPGFWVPIDAFKVESAMSRFLEISGSFSRMSWAAPLGDGQDRIELRCEFGG